MSKLRFVFLLLLASHAHASGEFNQQKLRACSSYIAQHCSGVKPGAGRVIQCLQDHASTLSTDCTEAVMPTDGAVGTASLQVTISGLQSKTGAVVVVLSDDPDQFPYGRRTIIVPVTGGQMMVTFRHLKPGNYAVMAMHDTNENNQFDQEATPREGIGFSNGVTGFPLFDSSAIKVERDTELSVALMYP